MYSINDIRVEVLNPELIKDFIKNHGVFACECYQTPVKYAEKVGLSCLKEGHTSGSRADYFKFRIHASRYTCDQIMRHEIGGVKNCQSQRYVSFDEGVSIYISPEVPSSTRSLMCAYEEMVSEMYTAVIESLKLHGYSGEKANDLARTMIPIGVECNLTMAFTIEALINFMNKRLCKRADAPIRKVAQLIRAAVLEIEPRYAEFLVPQCAAKLYCPEKHGCGAFPSKEELKRIIAINAESEYENKETTYGIDD